MARSPDGVMARLAGGLVKASPQFSATGGKPVSKQSLRALDGVNFFLADVRDGIGPYLGIYLLATHQWDAGSIGIAKAAMGFATVVAQTPAGALVDATKRKRLLIAGASLVAFFVLPIRGLLYTLSPSPYWIVGVQALDGGGRGNIRCAVGVGRGRSDTRHRTIQCHAGCNRHGRRLGASLSNLVAGYVVDLTGYRGGFLFLGACAVLALLVFYFGVPETRRQQS
jgi:sugar phosphate permease